MKEKVRVTSLAIVGNSVADVRAEGGATEDHWRGARIAGHLLRSGSWCPRRTSLRSRPIGKQCTNMVLVFVSFHPTLAIGVHLDYRRLRIVGVVMMAEGGGQAFLREEALVW